MTTETITPPSYAAALRPETPYRQLRVPRIPDAAKVPGLREAVAEVHRLRSARPSHVELATAVAAVRGAAAVDTASSAAAIRSGKTAPPPTVEAARARLAELERRAAGAALAARQAERDAQRLADRDRDVYAAELRELAEADRAAVEASIAVLHRAIESWFTTRTLLAWIENPRAKAPSQVVRALSARNHRVTSDDVLQGLTAWAQGAERASADDEDRVGDSADEQLIAGALADEQERQQTAPVRAAARPPAMRLPPASQF